MQDDILLTDSTIPCFQEPALIQEDLPNVFTNIAVYKGKRILMSAKFLIVPNGKILLYLRLCIDIGPIRNQYFDYFCLSSEGGYVQCCVSFLK